MEGTQWAEGQRARNRCLCCDTRIGARTGHLSVHPVTNAQSFQCGTCGAELIRDVDGDPWRFDEKLPQPVKCPPDPSS